MSGLRERIAEALVINVTPGAGWAARLADVLLSLPGVAVVELPEGRVRDSEITRWSTQVGQVTRWRGLVQHSRGETWRPDEVRAFAAALLAAAAVAESVTP